MENTINIPIYIESRYRANRKKIKKAVLEVFKLNGVKSAVEVSVAIVGDRKMKSLNKKYRGLDKTTNVLSFSQLEGGASVLPSDVLFLGDVVVSYPQAILDAAQEEMLVDEKICELVAHGITHLLGIHHE